MQAGRARTAVAGRGGQPANLLPPGDRCAGGAGGRHRLVGRSEPAGVHHGHHPTSRDGSGESDHAGAGSPHRRTDRRTEVDTAVTGGVRVRWDLEPSQYRRASRQRQPERQRGGRGRRTCGCRTCGSRADGRRKGPEADDHQRERDPHEQPAAVDRQWGASECHALRVGDRWAVWECSAKAVDGQRRTSIRGCGRAEV